MFEDQSVFLIAAKAILSGSSEFNIMQKPPGILLPAILSLQLASTIEQAYFITSIATLIFHAANALLISTFCPSGNKLFGAIFFFCSFIGITTSVAFLVEPYSLFFILLGFCLIKRESQNNNYTYAGIPIAMALLFRPTALLALISGTLLLKSSSPKKIIAFVLPTFLVMLAGFMYLSSQGTLVLYYKKIFLFNSFHPLEVLDTTQRLFLFLRYLCAEILVLAILFVITYYKKIKIILNLEKSILYFSCLLLALLFTTRSFFDHYLYELLPLVTLVFVSLLSKQSKIVTTTVLSLYLVCSLLLVVDRVELGQKKLISCTKDYSGSLLTDLPQIVAIRGNTSEWYWQKSQEEAYIKADLNAYYGERLEFKKRIKESKPELIILKSKEDFEATGYSVIRYKLERPLRKYIALLFGWDFHEKEIVVAYLDSVILECLK